MNDHTEPMLTAIDEVETLAEELRALRDQTKKYGDASRRLSEIGDVLRELGNSVERIQGAFTSALGQIERTQAHAESGKFAVESLVDSVPDVVQRIEASDAFKSAASLTTSMREVTGLLHSHEQAIADLIHRFAQERDASAAILDKLGDTSDRSLQAIERVVSGITALQQATTQGFERVATVNGTMRDDMLSSINAAQKAVDEVKGLTSQVCVNSSRASDAMLEHSVKMLREMGALRADLVAMHRLLAEQGQQVLQQGQVLSEMSKNKKGWFS